MPYRFKLKESVGQGARRIATEQIDSAREELTSGKVSPDEAVHQVRKRFKKLRGLIRLIRDDLGDAYAEENAWYRDNAQLLSAARDAAVLVETFDAVRKSFDQQLQPEAFESARLTLIARREASAGQAHDLQERMAKVVDSLGEAAARVAEWPLEKSNFKSLRKGLEKIYDQGMERFEEAYDAPSAEAFHEWRKAAKYHWYHTRLLEGCWPEVMKARKKQLSDLADVLGDLHDLTVLRDTLLASPEEFGPWRDVQALTALIDQRTTELAVAARPMGERLYAEKASALGKRLERYWKATQGEKQMASERLQPPAIERSKDNSL